MRTMMAVIAGLSSLLHAREAFGQESGAWAGGGFSQRGTDFEASGAVLGVIRPSVPFSISRADISGVFSAVGGYDHEFDGGQFLGVEASLDASEVEAGLGPVTSVGSFPRAVDILQCPPPGFPGPCIIIPGPSWMMVESQTLALNVAEDIGGSLQLKGGYDFGDTKIWLSAGVVAQSVEVSYSLPALQRVSVPAGSEATATQLPAETRSEKETLTGTVIGFGAEHRLTDNLSLALTYRRSDFGEVEFADTVRVSGLRLGATSESGDISLRWRS